MAGYRRFIAYVYDYENGKKGSNCGFIKVEVKDQQCSVEVHLHCPGLPEAMGCRVYGFTRKDGLINGVLLDTCETEKEIIECMIVTDAMDMNASGISMGKMGGMIITTDSGEFFGTEWDDLPIRPENFREIKNAPATNISPVFTENTSKKSETPINTASKTVHEPIPVSDTTDTVSGITNSSDITATIQEILMPKSEETSAKLSEKTSSATLTDNADAVDAINNHEAIEIADSANANPHTESITSAIPANSPKNEAGDISTIPDSASYPAKSQTLNTPDKNVTPTPEVSSLQQNYSEHRKTPASSNPQVPTEFTPFSDGELTAAWKIHLNDLKRFPRHYCSLRNNRFIQYGHYNFGHLLLGQRNNGQYILGVPGGYNQQERFMANMFGFPYFKESRYVEIPKARGGYWYRLIDAPDSHR